MGHLIGPSPKKKKKKTKIETLEAPQYSNLYMWGENAFPMVQFV
jgi:hypothetical protein